MSTLTNWGYTITGDSTLADIITATEFNTATASRYAGDTRIAPSISAASLALRNHCGWHLTGSLACKIEWTAQNRGIIRTGSDLIVQLPARFVTAITSVEIAGVATTDYSFQPNGLLVIYDNGFDDRREILEVEYTAGITDVAAIQDLVIQMVTFALAKSYGVTSEAAGGVSITYSSGWTNGSFNQIMDNNAGLLAPYRLEGVF